MLHQAGLQQETDGPLKGLTEERSMSGQLTQVWPKEREVEPPHRGEGEGLPGNRLCCRML